MEQRKSQPADPIFSVLLVRTESVAIFSGKVKTKHGSGNPLDIFDFRILPNFLRDGEV